MDEQALRDEYRALVQKSVWAAEHGEHFRLEGDKFSPLFRGPLQSMIKSEWQLVHPNEDPGYAATPEIIEVRQRIMAGELYDAIQNAQPIDLDNFLPSVDDPMLTAAISWLSLRGGLKQADRDTFMEQFDPQKYGILRSVRSYHRPLVLLQLVRQHPELIGRLEENSGYFPHRLFQTKPLPKKTLETQITSEIAAELPAVFSEELLNVLPGISEFIADRTPSETDWKLGPYRIPASQTHCAFLTQDEAAVDTIKTLYGSLEIKREIFHTLLTAFRITGHACRARSGKSAGQMRGVPFTVSPIRYRYAMETIENFAKNQTFAAWQQQPTGIKASRLAQRLGMKVRVSTPDRLEIVYDRATDILRQGSKMYPTDAHLPFCVFLLHEQYRIAQDVNKQNSQLP